ncbi:hypothetical protein AB0J27_08550 [Micromonospora chokoriensis]
MTRLADALRAVGVTGQVVTIAERPRLANFRRASGLTSKALVGTHVLTRAFAVERVTGIEPALSAWEPYKIP